MVFNVILAVLLAFSVPSTVLVFLAPPRARLSYNAEWALNRAFAVALLTGLPALAMASYRVLALIDTLTR